MGTIENAAAYANNERELSIDKLIAINGIAKKTAEAMYQIGIHSYDDLVRYLSQHTAPEISVALKEHGVNRPPALIDREKTWIKQAEAFSQLENTTPTLPEGETEPAEKPEEVPFSPESREHVATRAEVTGGPPSTEIEVTVPPVRTEGRCDAQLKISDVQLSVIGPTSDVPEKRLKAEINFQLSGEDAKTLTSQGIPFRIEGYFVDLESGVSELVASGRSQLEPQVFQYRGQQKFAIPDVGRYEFHSIILLLPPGEMVAYHRGPIMKVVP